MVADIIDVVGLVLAVLFAGEDAADVRFALGAGAEAGGIGQQSLQELDGDDLLTIVVDGRGGEHAHILKAAHVVKVALAEGHEEADALDAGQVLAEGLDLLMVQQVHILLADLIKVVLALDAHGRDLDPLAVLHVAAGGRDLAQVDFGVEVGGKGVAVVTAVAVQNVDRVDGIELMLGSVGAVGLGYARVKAAAQQGGQAGVLKLFLVGPLPAVVKVGGETGLLAALLVDGAPFRIISVFRLIVGGVHVVDAAGKAGVHDGQILIGQGNVHDKVRLVGVDEVAELLHIIGIDLRGGDFGLGVRGQLGGEGIALGLGAAGDAQLGENIADLAALGDGDRCNAAAADNKNFAHDGTPLHLCYSLCFCRGEHGSPVHVCDNGKLPGRIWNPPLHPLPR